jgi:hypothetical protein
MATPAALLERYVEAKDFTRPHLMAEIYAPHAVLTYSILTDTITFPARVEGADAISATLVSDFALKFDRCRTYYICDSPPCEQARVVVVPWLVVMREHAPSRLRMGQGFYRWGFESQGPASVRVIAMHIHIERMDSINDPRGRLLDAIHSLLPYPWLGPAILHARFEAAARAKASLAFLDEFKAPLDLHRVGGAASNRASGEAGVDAPTRSD